MCGMGSDQHLSRFSSSHATQGLVNLGAATAIKKARARLQKGRPTILRRRLSAGANSPDANPPATPSAYSAIKLLAQPIPCHRLAPETRRPRRNPSHQNENTCECPRYTGLRGAGIGRRAIQYHSQRWPFAHSQPYVKGHHLGAANARGASSCPCYWAPLEGSGPTPPPKSIQHNHREGALSTSTCKLSRNRWGRQSKLTPANICPMSICATLAALAYLRSTRQLRNARLLPSTRRHRQFE
eukprot:scaffold32250_cov31-Tisochrysis_lutea.AAC.2